MAGTMAASGATYYVSEEGDDQNPGTEEQPFQTFQRADAALQPGDTVIVKDGHYDVGLGGFVTTKSGTKEQPIVWQAEHVGQVFVTNRREVTGFEPAEGKEFRVQLKQKPLFLLEDEDMLFPINLTGEASYQIWDGFVFEYGLCGWKTHYQECRFNTVRNCTFRYVGQGILGASDALIEHCHFERIGCTHWEHGIYCGGEDTVIRYCTFRDIAGGALHLYPGPKNITACYNVIGPSRVPHHIWGGTAGIYAWGQGGHKIFRNVIYGGHSGGILLNSDHCLVANNTIFDVKGTAIYAYDRVGHTIQNNVLAAGENFFYVGQPDNALDHNFYLGPGQWVWKQQPRLDFVAYRQASDQDAHSRCGESAGFVSSEEQDFRPAPGSPLVDAGVAIPGVTEGFQGRGPDIGAFEFGQEWPEKPGPVER